MASIKWIDYPTCHVAEIDQRSTDWFKLRTGALTASVAAEWGGIKETDLDYLTDRICGLSKVKTTDAMRIGTEAEPIIRDWYQNRIKAPIVEVGMGVWKENPIFRASPDGLVSQGDDHFVVEIKAPRKLYWSLISHAGAFKRGHTPQGDVSHIFPNHYAQMTATCAVFGRSSCDYVVVGVEDGKACYERIKFDLEHWNKLKTHGEKFYRSHVEPRLKANDLERLDP